MAKRRREGARESGQARVAGQAPASGQAAPGAQPESGGRAASGAQKGQTAQSANGAALDPKDPAADALTRARAAQQRGNLRLARSLARGVLAQERSAAAEAEAQRLLAETAPDPAALLTALLVAITLAVAAWLALLRARQ